MTSIPRVVAGIAAATALLLPLSSPAGAAPPAADRSVTSTAAPAVVQDAPVAARVAYTRTQRKARVDKLMKGGLGRFIKVKGRSKSALDGTFNWDDDGCSAPWWTGTAYYSALFNRACKRHDFGYRNLGWGYYTSKNLALSSTPGTKDAIDKVFLADMRNICNGTATPGSCYTFAQGFYGAVRKTGKAHTSFYKSECQPGLLCLFDDKGYKDRRVALTASENNMKDVSFGDKTSSVKNTSGVAWRLYDDADYRDRSFCVPRNTVASNLKDFDFGDKTSSARRYSTTYCP